MNLIDDIRTEQISSNRTLQAGGLDSATLASHIRTMLAHSPDRAMVTLNGAAKAAGKESRNILKQNWAVLRFESEVPINIKYLMDQLFDL